MDTLKAVILAAGKGTRMQSDLPKVLHEILKKPMVKYVIDAARDAGADEICLVVGYGADQVKASLEDEKLIYVIQEKQLGTGHAVRCAKDFIGREGETLILFGDTPIITGTTLRHLVEEHRREQNGVTVLSTIVDDPSGYGRIIRDEHGNFQKSVEHKDATEKEREATEINSGMYVFNSSLLYDTLDLLKNDNVQKEYYLPDTLTIIKNTTDQKVDAVIAEDSTEIQGVNTMEQLWEAKAIIGAREE